MRIFQLYRGYMRRSKTGAFVTRLNFGGVEHKAFFIYYVNETVLIFIK